MDDLRDVLAGCGQNGEVVLSGPLTKVVTALSEKFRVKYSKDDVKLFKGGCQASVAYLRKLMSKVPPGFNFDQEAEDLEEPEAPATPSA